MTADQPVALVTGTSSGIGKETAFALPAAGFDVVGTGRDTPRATPLGGATFLDLDVVTDASVAAVLETSERFGRIDVLVDNAGVGWTGAAEETSVAQAPAVFDMRAQRSGRVINISSVLGFLPQPSMATYAVSKHAIECYTEPLDHEVRDHGVRALIVEPACTRTGFEAAKGGDAPAVVAKAIVAAATDPKPRPRYPAWQVRRHLEPRKGVRRTLGRQMRVTTDIAQVQQKFDHPSRWGSVERLAVPGVVAHALGVTGSRRPW
ncbi:SDR family NAD(P)-dependent oxidoreductase [Streptomyces fuscichromogenes]|uniref:SDR family NAD(P)-dependent oxidoreductase n=1 Tax=Streptomyces fuscichromogenes TaxID=1324013 RepID=UPI00382F63DE